MEGDVEETHVDASLPSADDALAGSGPVGHSAALGCTVNEGKQR